MIFLWGSIQVRPAIKYKVELAEATPVSHEVSHRGKPSVDHVCSKRLKDLPDRF